MIREFKLRKDSYEYAFNHKRKQQSKQYINEAAYCWGSIVQETMLSVWYKFVNKQYGPALEELQVLKLNQDTYEYHYLARLEHWRAYNKANELIVLYALIEIAERVMRYEAKDPVVDLRMRISHLFSICDTAMKINDDKKLKSYVDAVHKTIGDTVGDLKKRLMGVA